jgi:DNA-binding transcriptional LysR family regulator
MVQCAIRDAAATAGAVDQEQEHGCARGPRLLCLLSGGCRRPHRRPMHRPPRQATPMTLNQLRYFAAIADAELNITLAAQRVHATQPGLSKQLKQLEDELGFQLFVRKGKSLASITPAGEQVLARARLILEESRNIRALAANLRRATTGSLQIGTTHTQARYVLPPVLGRLHQDFPDVAIRIVPGSSAEMLDQLAAGDLDLVVLSTTGSPPAGVVALPAFRWDRVIVVPRGHALAQRTGLVTLEDLARWALVTYEPASGGASSIGRAFAAASLEPRFALTALDADVLKTYVANGLGVGILAPMALDAADDQRFEVLDAAHLFPRCTTWIARAPGRVLPRYAADLAALLAPHIPRSAFADDAVRIPPDVAPLFTRAVSTPQLALAG